MKKIVSIILCVLLVSTFIAGCGLRGNERGPTIPVFISDFPQTLDPALVPLNADIAELLSLLFIPLVSIDSNGRVVPALASSWEPFYDTVHEEYGVTFILHETSWNDTRTVQASDVVYAWRRILHPNFESPHAALLFPIKKK